MATSVLGLASKTPRSPRRTPTMKNLPVIEHPRAGVDKNLDLKVMGECKMTLDLTETPKLGPRHNTFVAMDTGVDRIHLGLDRENLPLLSNRPGYISARSNVNYNLDLWDPVGVTARNASDRGKFRNTIDGTPQYNTIELIYMVQAKIESGYHGMKHMFKSHDPTFQGKISRAALQKILYSLVGYVSQDEFNKLLTELGLGNKQNISFDEFVGCFKQNENESMQWMTPYKKASLTRSARIRKSNQEELLRHSSWSSSQQPHSALVAYAKLKTAARNRHFRIQDLLPEECFQGQGLVLSPHLKNMLNVLGHHITEQEFAKLWNRFDTKDIGAVKIKTFLWHLGLDGHGSPVCLDRAKTELNFKASRSLSRNYQLSVTPTVEKNSENTTELTDKKTESITEHNDKDSAPTKAERTRTVRKRNVPSNLDRITDRLFYMFEEPYQAMLLGLQCFDFMENSCISRVDLQKVLKEFGFPIGAMDLEYFLSRIGIRTIQGQINYKEFLMKFWNRSPLGMVQRLISTLKIRFTVDPQAVPSNADNLTVTELESALVEYFHGKYFYLLNKFKEVDRHTIGVVTQYEFRHIIEKLLGNHITDMQWEGLKDWVGLDPDGLVSYTKFMESFNTNYPGSWNKRDQMGHVVAQVRKIETPAVVTTLKDIALSDKERQHQLKERHQRAQPRFTQNLENMIQAVKEKGRTEGRSVEELSKSVYELFQENYHELDQAFKIQDRRMTGRYGMVQFSDVLKSLKVSMTPDEVKRVWESFRLDADGLVTFTALVRYFTDYAKAHNWPQAKDIPLLEDQIWGPVHNIPDTPLHPTVVYPDYNGFYTFAYAPVPNSGQLPKECSANYPMLAADISSKYSEIYRTTLPDA